MKMLRKLNNITTSKTIRGIINGFYSIDNLNNTDIYFINNKSIPDKSDR